MRALPRSREGKGIRRAKPFCPAFSRQSQSRAKTPLRFTAVERDDCGGSMQPWPDETVCGNQVAGRCGVLPQPVDHRLAFGFFPDAAAGDHDQPELVANWPRSRGFGRNEFAIARRRRPSVRSRLGFGRRTARLLLPSNSFIVRRHPGALFARYLIPPADTPAPSGFPAGLFSLLLLSLLPLSLLPLSLLRPTCCDAAGSVSPAGSSSGDLP